MAKPIEHIEAVFQDGAFWPRDHINLEPGSRVVLELKTVHAPPAARKAETKWDPDAEALAGVGPDVLAEICVVPVRDIEGIERKLEWVMNYFKLPPIERGDVEHAVSELLKAGYIEEHYTEATFVPATLAGYRLTPAGFIGTLHIRREKIARDRKEAGLKPRRRRPLPAADVIVANFEDLDIGYFGLGIRTIRVLKANGLETAGSLCRLTLSELRQIPRIGPHSTCAIEYNLENVGLALKVESGEP